MTEPDGAPEPASNRNKVEITLGGATIVVDSDESLGIVKHTALDLARTVLAWTGPRETFGFAAPAPVIERAEPFPMPGPPPYGSETERAPRYGRADARDGSRRLPRISASD